MYPVPFSERHPSANMLNHFPSYILRGYNHNPARGIHKLSVELLSLIFTFSVNGEIDNRMLGCLRRVCGRWRLVTLSTPQLWTLIEAKFTSMSTEKDDLRVHQFLQRSGECPIWVRLVLSVSDQANHPTLRKLLSVSYRWHAATITISFSSLAVLNPIKSRIGRIQDLQLNILEDRNSHGQHHFDLLESEGVPYLTSMRLDWFTPYPWISIPWTQLRKFQGSYHSLKQMLYMLMNLTHVEELEVNGWVRPLPQAHLDAIPINFQNVTVGSLFFPNLHTLLLRNSVKPDPDAPNYTPPIAQALNAMTTPALKKMVAHRAVTNHLFHLLDRSKCDLNDLTLEGDLFSTGYLSDILELTPNLVRLHLGLGLQGEIRALCIPEGPRNVAKDPFTLNLRAYSAKPVLVPNLKYLYIDQMNSRKTPCPTVIGLKNTRIYNGPGEAPFGRKLELIKVSRTISSGRMGLYHRNRWTSWLETYIIILVFLAFWFPQPFKSQVPRPRILPHPVLFSPLSLPSSNLELPRVKLS